MKLKETSDQIPTNIDPRIQRIIELSQKEETVNILASEENEIPVIAKITDFEAWKQLPGVRQMADLGSDPDEPSNRIVTARVALTEIENIRNSPVVLSLKTSQPLKSVLAKTVEDIKAKKELLPPGIARDRGGEGVIVGIVDIGCDFTHKNFRNPDGSTRIINYWNQNTTTASNSPFGYGRVFTREDMNQALQTDEPFKTLGVHDPNDDSGPWHGTHVMDIAAGNGAGTGNPGVAPQADIVFVDINPNDISWMGQYVVDNTLGSSVHLLEGLQYIFQFAGDRPCVINVSLGTNGGPHDGTSLVEKGIDALVSQAPGRAVVIAAGNSYHDGIHAAGRVQQDKSVDLHWVINKRDFTYNELEIWYDGADEFLGEVINPKGENIGTIRLGTNAQVLGRNHKVLLFIAHRKGDPNNGDNVMNIFMERGLPAGKWTIRLRGVKVNSGEFHAWIERDDGGQSNFEAPLDNSHTLGSICCGGKSIVVGCYNAYESDTPISFFSSSGPTRDGRKKPEVSAPGQQVKAAASGSGSGITEMSGTSMAAPAVTGLIALLFAETRAHGCKLSVDEIRELLSSQARPIGLEGWEPRYGVGRVDASETIKALPVLAPVP